jgi:hypothetical protein
MRWITAWRSAIPPTLSSCDPAMAVAELAQPSFGLKRGRRSFSHAAATLHHP